MKKIVERWAITYKTGTESDDCLTGFINYESVGYIIPYIPYYVSGSDVALFKTRQYARETKKNLDNMHFKVVPVKVTIESQGDKNGIRMVTTDR